MIDMARRSFALDFDPTATQTHADLVRQIAQYLRLRGWLVLQVPRGGIPGMAGFPDLMAFRAGHLLLVEAKVGADKLDFYQRQMKASLEAAGFDVVEARSLEDVMIDNLKEI